MAFVGVAFGILPLPVFYLQAYWILSVWKSDNTLPSKEEMLKDIRDEYGQKLKQGIYHLIELNIGFPASGLGKEN